jgi:protein SCO1/2
MNFQRRLARLALWDLFPFAAMAIAGLFLFNLLHRPSKPLPVYGHVPDFTLTNQLSQAVSLGDLKGQVWVADVIFTRCPGPCAQMTRTMKRIQEQLPPESPVKLISLTADPEFDTPPVLRAYADRFKAEPKNWDFLTGPKLAVYDLAMKGLKLAVQENATTNLSELFIHSTRMVVVDPLGRLRAVEFDGVEKDVVPNVLRAVDQLVRERRS